MNKAILDTDTYSEIAKGKNKILVTRAAAYEEFFLCHTITTVTVAEVIKGFQKKRNYEKLRAFLDFIPDMEVLPLDVESAKIAGCIYGDLDRIGKGIGRCDPLIAGIAIYHNVTLVTGNTEHYQRIQALGYPLTLDNWKE